MSKIGNRHGQTSPLPGSKPVEPTAPKPAAHVHHKKHAKDTHVLTGAHALAAAAGNTHPKASAAEIDAALDHALAPAAPDPLAQGPLKFFGHQPSAAHPYGVKMSALGFGHTLEWADDGKPVTPKEFYAMPENQRDPIVEKMSEGQYKHFNAEFEPYSPFQPVAPTEAEVINDVIRQLVQRAEITTLLGH